MNGEQEGGLKEEWMFRRDFPEWIYYPIKVSEVDSRDNNPFGLRALEACFH
jgi:hypothetical protein